VPGLTPAAVPPPLTAFRSAMIGLFAAKTCCPAYGATSSVNRPWESTGTTGSIPAASVAFLSSSPKAGARWTTPVPSSVVTKSAASTRCAPARPAKNSNGGR
jgi:hypothetical protein